MGAGWGAVCLPSLPSPFPSPSPLSPPPRPRGCRYPLVYRETQETHCRKLTPPWASSCLGRAGAQPLGSPSQASWPQAALVSGVPREPRLSQNLPPPCYNFLSSGFSVGRLTQGQGRPWGWRSQCGVVTSSPSSRPRPLLSLVPLPSFPLPRPLPHTPSPSCRRCHRLPF